MDLQLAAICFIAFGIQPIDALVYAACTADTRTGRIAMSFTLFNVLVLLSRLSN